METTFAEPLAAPEPEDRADRLVTLAPTPHVAPIPLEPAGRQWLPVSAHVRERYLMTFRAPAAAIARLCPAPLVVDSFRGHGFVSVCALELEQMGIAGTPSWLRFANLEFLYRVGVRLHGAPSFLTLRSDVSARALALLGRPFSHYRPHLAQIHRARPDGRFRLVCRSRDGAADAEFEAAPDGAAPVDALFSDPSEAAAFMLGMRFSVDVRPDGRVRAQPIDHDPWGARFATPTRRHFAYVDALARAIGAPLVYDHTLAMGDLRQLWRASRWI